MCKFSQRKMAVLANKDFWCEFFELYKSMPELWKVQSPDYTSRHKKTAGYKVLTDKLREVDGNADRETVVKKINTFRGNFRRELNKLKRFQKANAHYEPKLWYFKNLSFLLESNKRLGRVGEESEDSNDNEDNNDNSYGMKDFENADDDDNDDFNEDSEQSTTRTSLTVIKHEICSAHDQADDNFQEVYDDCEERTNRDYFANRNNSSGNTRANLAEVECVQMNELSTGADEAEMFGKCWILQYRQLTKDQKVFAKKAIEDILFEAKLGTLHRNSVRINQESFEISNGY